MAINSLSQNSSSTVGVSRGGSISHPVGLRSSETHFKFFLTNIQGLHSNINSVHQLMQSKAPDLLILTELQIKQPLDVTHLQHHGFNFYSSFRVKTGVCCYVKSSLAACHLKKLDLNTAHSQALWLKLHHEQRYKYICLIYRSPNDRDFENLFASLSLQIEALLVNNPSCEIILLGDFNVHNTDWLPYSFSTDAAGRAAQQFTNLNGLTQLINEPTRIPDRDGDRSQLLDLFLTTHPDNYSTEVASPLGTSDHCLIQIYYPVTPPERPTIQSRRIWKFSHADWDGLREFYAQYPWRDICFVDDINQSAENLTEAIKMGMEMFIPSRNQRQKATKVSWFNSACSSAIGEKNRLFKIWKRFPTPENRSAYVAARNSCNSRIDVAKSNFVSSVAQKISACPSYDKRFWTLANSISKNFQESRFPPMKDSSGAIFSSAQSKANLFAETFASNSTLNDGGRIISFLTTDGPPLQDIRIQTKSVRRALLNLNINKATGPDEIPARVLKRCAPELAPVFQRLFHLSLTKNTYPLCWKIAHIVPVHKKGDRSLTSNYRPISITSVISKVFEDLINKIILKHLEVHSLLSDSQYGFRKSRSTADLLAFITHKWTNSFEAFGESRAVALDISKAFDRVWHKSLLAKLKTFGLTPLSDWICSFLTNRSIAVRIDGALSSFHTTNAGVPQGCVLSPTLFLLFINDLLGICSSLIHSYADDTTIHSSTFFRSQAECRSNLIESRASCGNQLNDDLLKIMDWGDKNLVTFNSQKTQAINVSTKRNSNFPPVSMANETLTVLENITVLGIQISCDLSWNSQINSIAKRASQKLGYLFRAQRYFSPKDLSLLYKAQVRPLMEYCSHIWGGAPTSSLKALDKVQDRAIRLINDPSLTNNLASLSHRRSVSCLSLYYRYYNGRCSNELSGCIPPPLVLTANRQSRFTDRSHQFAVTVPTCRTSLGKSSFFSRVSATWNALPAHVFPQEYNLQTFKRRINKLAI